MPTSTNQHQPAVRAGQTAMARRRASALPKARARSPSSRYDRAPKDCKRAPKRAKQPRHQTAASRTSSRQETSGQGQVRRPASKRASTAPQTRSNTLTCIHPPNPTTHRPVAHEPPGHAIGARSTCVCGPNVSSRRSTQPRRAPPVCHQGPATQPRGKSTRQSQANQPSHPNHRARSSGQS